MFNFISYYFKRGVGSSREFSMENRVFNGMCLMCYVLLFVFIPFNLYLGIYSQTIIMIILLIPLTIVYYLSRVKHRFEFSVSILIIAFLVVLIANYFVNAGVSGPTLLYFFMISHIISAVSGSRYRKYWFVLSLLSGLSLLIIDYLYPNMVVNNYDNRNQLLLDYGLAFVISMAVIYFTMKFILANYQQERKLAIKNASEMEQQQKKLEFLNSEKDKLFSIVSHDFRSPLAALQTSLEILTEHDLDEKDEREIKAEMLNQLRYTSGMLDNVLSWSRAQLKSIEAQIIELSVKEEVKQIITSVLGLAEQKQLSIKNNVGDDFYILADREMMQFILRNLINNAIKFTPNGGNIEVSATENNGQVIIAIHDTGIGMSKEQLANLFTFNVSSTYGTNNEKGMGLGLHICMDLIKKQKGQITVNSKEGQGTTFFITLKGRKISTPELVK